MYSETEKPGSCFPIETQKIIRDRYEFAATLVYGKKILEVGSGAGFGVKYLSKYSKVMHCLEYSVQNIKLIKSKKFSKAIIRQGDAHRTSYKANSFDVIVALAMIYYLNYDTFIAEVNRILRKDGTLFFCMSNKDVPGFVPAPYTTQYFSIPEIWEKMSLAGFSVTFQGAFPVLITNTKILQVRSLLKRVLKGCVFLFPGGIKLWGTMRQRYLGEHEALPEDIEAMAKYTGTRTSLDPHSQNKIYRVIYVTARKLK